MNPKKIFLCFMILPSLCTNPMKPSDDNLPTQITAENFDALSSQVSVESLISLHSTSSLLSDHYETSYVIDENQTNQTIDNIFEQHKQSIIASFIENKSDEEKKMRHQRSMQRKLVAGSAGIALTGGLIYSNILTSNSLKRIFVIDDLMAAAAANATLQALAGPILATIGGIVAWRQLDYYLHAEERSHFVVLEHKFENAFKEIKLNVTKEFTKRDKEYAAQHKKIYTYVDNSLSQAISNTEKEIKSLHSYQKHQRDFIKQIQTKTDSDYERIKGSIKDGQDNYEKAQIKINEVLITLTEQKDNYKEMKNTFQKMCPLVQSIHQELLTKGQPFVKKTSQTHDQGLSQELTNIQIHDDEDEHKENTPQAPIASKKIRSSGFSLKSRLGLKKKS